MAIGDHQEVVFGVWSEGIGEVRVWKTEELFLSISAEWALCAALHEVFVFHIFSISEIRVLRQHKCRRF